MTIETADKVKLDYRIATPLFRFGAFLIDFLIFIILVILIVRLLDVLDITNTLGGIFNPEMLGALLGFFYYVLLFILRWGYYLFFEMLFEGRTPGKMIFRLRTIQYQGKPLDLSSIVLRNFARIVDQDLTLFLGAAVCMLINREYRRIGDLLANTIVIREEKLLPIERAFQFELELSPPVSGPVEALLIKRLSEQDLYVLRRLLNAHLKIPEQRRKELLAKMAAAVREKIRDPNDVTDPLAYLTEIYSRHQHGDTVKQVH